MFVCACSNMLNESSYQKSTEVTGHLAVCVLNYFGKIDLRITVDVTCLRRNQLGKLNIATGGEEMADFKHY